MANIFSPLATSDIPLPSRSQHPIKPDKIRGRTNRLGDGQPCQLTSPAPPGPIPTNKFYANLFLGEQTCAAWTHPYSLTWCKGRGNAQSWGLGISHIETHQMALGPVKPESGAVQYFLSPLGIYSVILSAEQLDPNTSMTVDSPTAFSANINFSNPSSASPALTVPLLQGMAFVTGLYYDSTPLVQSSVFFRSMQPAGQVNDGATSKYRAVLEDGTSWLIYLTPDHGHPPVELAWFNNTTLKAASNFSGQVQIAKLPADAPEDVYDRSAGVYPVACELAATVDGPRAQYSFSWTKAGRTENPLLMFALPHHVASFDRNTAGKVRPVYLQTTTKGIAVTVQADSWTLVETLPVDIGFAPWCPETGSVTQLPPAAAEAVIAAGRSDIEQDVLGQCALDSMYFSGKGLAKFAMIAYTLHDMVSCPDLAHKCLDKVKSTFDVFVRNGQPNPLTYDETWGGSVSTAGLQGDAGADFGNSYYNDHHFHYGYFVYTAAVITHLDPAWIRQENRMNWINMLVRDFANPVTDAEFPFSRSFDWFAGHSWAKGLFESADGKDQESTSEDGFASYAVKMWGKLSGDSAMEQRGNLMLAVQARSFCKYFLTDASNTIQPGQFIGNKVTGILFENKCDHATYFGGNIEYIQGIHMIPANPTSALTRQKHFVAEEWDVYFSKGRVDGIEGGWRGILYANLALVDPVAAYNFFSHTEFQPVCLDGGASRTWYLAYCAALGGAGPVKGQGIAPAQVPLAAPVAPATDPGTCAAADETAPEQQRPPRPGPGLTEEQSRKKKLLNRLFGHKKD